jgi:hypothetical protein
MLCNLKITTVFVKISFGIQHFSDCKLQNRKVREGLNRKFFTWLVIDYWGEIPLTPMGVLSQRVFACLARLLGPYNDMIEKVQHMSL